MRRHPVPPPRTTVRPAADLFRQARQAHAEHDLARAEGLYRMLLQARSSDPDTLGSLGTICHQTGRHDEAIELFSRALRDNPRAPDLLANLGVVLLAAGRAEESLTRCDQALALLPRHPAIQDNRGNALNALGRYTEALAAYDRAVALAPDFAEAHDNRGVALEHLKRYHEALEAHERSLALRPDSARALYNRGVVLLRLRRPADALEAINRALAIQPIFPEAVHNRGVALLKLHRPAEALDSFDQALALKPDYRDAARSRGMALVELHRPEEALTVSERLLGDDAAALQVRAAALIELNRPEEAVGDLERAVPDDHDPAAVWTLRGQALHKLGRFDEALTNYRKALEVEPDNPICQWNLSNAELTQGDFEDGWKRYEARWQLDDHSPPVDVEPWLGVGDVSGKTVLVHCEQGFGDTIQFCRYVPLLVERGADVILRVQSALKDLISSLRGVARVIDTSEPLPAFDLYCPIASLPLAMGTTLESIPARVPYLQATPGLAADWERQLSRPGGRPRPTIGVAVSGNPQHRNDRNRSMPLALLSPLFNLNFRFVLLQQALDERDRPTLAQHASIAFFGKDLKTFSDTAALIEQMDLVITVDTSVAHLAGALGKPVWIMLPLCPDWRWLLNRTDSPWYPTARLFRQKRLGDWSGVVNSVREALGGQLETTESG